MNQFLFNKTSSVKINVLACSKLSFYLVMKVISKFNKRPLIVYIQLIKTEKEHEKFTFFQFQKEKKTIVVLLSILSTIFSYRTIKHNVVVKNILVVLMY